MALANKLGGLLKKATSSNPSVYQAIRCMSSKLFVGGISYQTDDHSLRDEFAKYGQVIEARIIIDRESGRSRGFGFVTYTSSEEASAAITALDGKYINADIKTLDGRSIRVNHANEKTGSDSFANSNFGSDSSFGGNGAGGFDATGGSTGDDGFSGTPDDNFGGNKNEETMDDIFKDDEPDSYADKRS
ncbi:Glycine-rich RNA-binding protein 3, mitochondrial [Zea mays]|uniref:Glycine-rich RNA-binding protein 3, mitochondrial n=1 Tax=Zea mays TaxID=4577 RepID=A0A3L6FD00_MAIZE|nr:Glycine-rich RNA-binding protein 3, mitochondrial [Zea mays]